MVVIGLVAALFRSSYKWGYFTFGCVALSYILYTLVWEARRRANLMGKNLGRVFYYPSCLTSFLLTLYPIAFGLCEGGDVISPDMQAVSYGCLDAFADPVFWRLTYLRSPWHRPRLPRSCHSRLHSGGHGNSREETNIHTNKQMAKKLAPMALLNGWFG